MKFGANTFIWSAGVDGALLQLLPEIRDAGFDGVELPLIHPADLPVREIRDSLHRNQLECTFCSVLPEGLNAISEDAGVRRRTQLHLVDCIHTAADAGASLVAGPLYAPVGHLPGRRRTADEWNWAVECFQALGTTLQDDQITLALEPLNRFETYFLNTVADGLKLAGAIGHPNVGLLFDTFHANIEEKDVAAALRSAAPYLKHFHASENDRGTPGTGHTDWAGVCRTLEEIQYDGWVTIESFGFALGELSAAASIWRDLASSSDAIAFQGVQFLRKELAAKEVEPA